MRSDIELLELLKEKATEWHRTDIQWLPSRPAFAYNKEEVGGLCGVNGLMQSSHIISDGEYYRLVHLIAGNYSLAMDMPESTFGLWYFKYGELEPRLQYIDLIIEKLKQMKQNKPSADAYIYSILAIVFFGMFLITMIGCAIINWLIY